MWNIIEFNQIARGEQIRLFTACGIFEGQYRGSESITEGSDDQWVTMSDVVFSPARGNVPPEDSIRMSDASLQLSQIIALDLDVG